MKTSSIIGGGLILVLHRVLKPSSIHRYQLFVKPYQANMSMSMPKPEQYGGEPPAYTDADAELLFDIRHPPTAESSRQRLDLPLCLPQTTSGYDSPFARAYNPQLEASGIEQDEWLKFLDALNIAMVGILLLPRFRLTCPSDCKPPVACSRHGRHGHRFCVSGHYHVLRIYLLNSFLFVKFKALIIGQ